MKRFRLPAILAVIGLATLLYTILIQQSASKAQEASGPMTKTNGLRWLEDEEPSLAEQIAANQREMDRLADEHLRRKAAREQAKRALLESVQIREKWRQEDLQHDVLAELKRANEIAEQTYWQREFQYTRPQTDDPRPMEDYLKRQTLWELQQMRMEQQFDNAYWRSRSYWINP